VSAATTAVFSQPAVVPLTTAEFKSADIGAPAIKGSMSFRDGVYTVQAAGADIAGTADQFHFVYQQVTGDVEVVARVQSLTNSNGWAKAGVMIRETLTAGSRHASAFSTYQYGYVFQRRADTGALSDSTAGPEMGRPGWVRLVRSGSQIQSFYSANGTSWTSMGVDAIPMADTVYVGLAVTSHRTNRATTAVLDNLRVTRSGAASNRPPLVALTAPGNGATFTAGTNVSVSAAASDGDGTISRVDFFAGATAIGSDTTAPYAVTWQIPSGTYSLTASAVDNDGARTTSASVTVSASAATNAPPAVTLTAPANGASYTAPATIAVSATATDSNGIARVEFYRGTTLLATDTSSPYGYSWTSVAAGTYAVRAVAYDNAGASASSATANITVATATTATGLVAAYGLNAGAGTTISSDSGSGPQGTISGATWAPGKYGQGLSFTGGGVANFGDFDLTGAFTVMGWLQTRSLYSSTCGSFIMKAHDYGFEICGGRLYANVGANGSWTARASQPLTTADLNVWKHVALTYDGTTLRFYIGGTLISSVAGAHTTTNNPLLFGRWTSGEYWNGLVDEVRIYSSSLTQAKIQTDMNTPIGTGSANQPPTVSLTTPATGATYTAPASVAMTASASDPENSLARVEFYSGTTLLASDTTAPYAYTWSSVPAGSYSLRAVAYDTAGASASTATRSITVSSTTTTSPPRAVVFQASPDHATLVTRYELRIFASGANVLTAIPLVTSDLGKPTPTSTGEITVDRATVFTALAVGNYVAAVRAIGSAGTSTSTGVAFTR
jgi:hypothetical protein